MSILITKLMVHGQLPSYKDQTFILLLAIHFLTFVCFECLLETGLMERLRKSELRMVLQETFKGYGKGLNLLLFVEKGISQSVSLPYFVLVCVVRGSASATFKSGCLSVLLGEPLSLKKARENFYNNTLPTIFVYLLHHFLPAPILARVALSFILYMTLSRALRSI